MGGAHWRRILHVLYQPRKDWLVSLVKKDVLCYWVIYLTRYLKAKTHDMKACLFIQRKRKEEIKSKPRKQYKREKTSGPKCQE